MCNAWNHPQGCKCGWGGEGHLGGGGNYGIQNTNRNINWEGFDRKSFDSYVNPNAICHVCGVPLYFYQSESGGKVFFDELGPPWPKHPCTDSGNNISLVQTNVSTSLLVNTRWEQDGWIPVDPVIPLIPSTKDEVVFRPVSLQPNHRVYDTKIANKWIRVMIFQAHSLVFVRHRDHSRFEVSIYDTNTEQQYLLTFSYITTTH